MVHSFPQKKTPAEAGLPPSRERRYWLELEDDPLVPVEPALPVLDDVPVEPVAEGAEPLLAVLSRLPSNSASTRRSGCRQAISFWFLLLSLPSFWHSLPVRGCDSPRPSTCRRLESTPRCARKSATACARFSDSSLLYSSEPIRSAWPIRFTFSTFAPWASRASCSSFSSPAGVSCALLKPNSTSVESETFSITTGCGAGVGSATARGCGSGAGAG